MKKLLILLSAVYLTGCAMGNKYNYEAGSMDIPVKPSGQDTIVLSVEDWRPYVLDGDKEPNFVGLQRGGFGNPFDVTTASGKPMIDEMSVAVIRGLKGAGFKVVNVPGKRGNTYLVETASKNGAVRIVVLRVLDWKSDVFMGVTLNCDLHLSVLDKEGKMLAESKDRFIGKVASGSWATESDNSQALAEEFSRRVETLFNSADVKTALQ